MKRPDLNSSHSSTSGPHQHAAVSNHVVQFYEDDRFLTGVVGDFLTAGITDGEPLLILATQPHREAFLQRLQEGGLDVDHASRMGRLTLLDARSTLSTFMDGPTPNAGRFQTHLGAALECILGRTGHTTVRAYGEMVDLLWKDGNPEGAIRIEELWNELARTHPFKLLCAYAMGNFSEDAQSELFLEVCRRHGQVRPTEQYVRADEGTRLREISLLQQKAHVLENELTCRRELEKTLYDALETRRRTEEALRDSLAREEMARRQAEQAQAEAESANQIKDEFLAVLSHELRSPLSVILGWMHIVKTQTADKAMIRRALEVIDRNAGLQLRLIEDLLDISRIASGKMQVSADPVDLATVVTAALESIGPAAAAKGITLDVRIDDGVHVATGDASRLQQVVWNLLSNAVKFTSKGGRVEVRLQHVDSDAQIVVRDTGRGIAPEFLAHVFDRFRQANTGTARTDGGLGLGLSIVRHLVEAHGGQVRADSAGLEQGAVFTVTLPLRAARADVVVGQALSLSPTRLTTHVLVVDDDADARELVQYILEQSGASVVTAESVRQALTLISARPFDVLVADIGMPEQDGYALIAAIRNHREPRVRVVPAVAVTAYSGAAQRAKVLAAGYDEHVSKPVDAAHLTAVLSELIARGEPSAAS